mmetsp:Transcript_10144/g.21963  ORF Transcript_10144/g.21963 Transcript_10144/m.21963 type:complete len:607 (-) Transcript_10144:158-1978(-)
MPLYNLRSVKTPRLCGRLLDLFSRILRLPIIGRMIIELIKKKNKINEMVRFAMMMTTKGTLYYPIHEMTREEEAMHRGMVKETPLDLKEVATMEMEPVSSSSINNAWQEEEEEFRHWKISDYTSRYLNGTTTPSKIVDRLIRIIQNMNDKSKNSSIVTQMNVEQLRSEAAQSTKRYQDGTIMGVLDGVPILVKDEVPTVGFPVTRGVSFLSKTVEKDVFPILKLKQQGALLVGKTNQHEIGLGTTGYNLFHGTPRNPYGKDDRIHYYTGGSSSGCAAAVSMGLVPLAIGGDGGGSIRIPSSLCGCVGLKPTFKRMLMDTASGSSVFHLGPMTANVHDAALAYAIMAGEAEDDHRHQSRKQPPVHLHAYVTTMKDSRSLDSLRGLRIGIFEEHIEDADANVVAVTRKAIEHYQSRGAEIIQIAIPHLQEIHVAHGVTITTEIFSHMENHYYSNRYTKFSPETRVSLAVGASWSSSEFLAAQKIRSYAMDLMEDMFRDKVDIILSPATPCVAPQLREDAMSHGESNLTQTAQLMRYAVLGNFTGIPAMVFPVGYDDETSLPISLQIQAAHWREDLLFRVARESNGILEHGIAKPAMYVDVLGTENDDG